MTRIGLWQIKDNGPVKINESDVGLEKNLEDWIERDPALLQSGLTIVGRQVYVEGGPLDLLALDPQGQWVVIELKADTLRRDTVAQVLDYASCIATLPYETLAEIIDGYLAKKNTNLRTLLEERGVADNDTGDDRDVIMYIVGTGREVGLERMVSFLAERFEMPINVVTFDVFKLENGQQILLRELMEAEFEPLQKPSRKKVEVNDVLSLADKYPTSQAFRRLQEAAQNHNLYIRAWPSSLMYTPPTNRTRCLYTAWTTPQSDGKLKVYVETTAFSEFFPISVDDALSILGEAGYRYMDTSDVDEFVEALDRLFEGLKTG
jgi:Holliday junction resolvase-like predicted endonuclease